MIGIRWLGHATTVVDLGGVRLVTDPLLRRHVGALRRVGPTPDPAWWSGADAALVSHLHLDHADRPSLRRLGVPVLGGPAVAAWAGRQGLGGVALSEEWTTVAGAVQVRLVRADHASRPLPGRPREAYGFLVRAGEDVVWFAGDTALYPEMAELADASISAALLPIHGWGPRLSAGHMDAEQAAEAALLSGARHVVPVHWGTFHAVTMNLGSLNWMTRPVGVFEAAMDRRGIADRALVLGLGERVEVA
ncbi:MAG TPA: MBL fold metallo-hydrolase [Lapillicoccus sp.]|nr:MBL fold metallo-hydrolase [Lapillicoccus sp.]